MKFLLLLAAFFMAAPLYAQTTPAGGAATLPAPDSASIAAVINGEVITNQDVLDRARLFAVSTGLNPSPDLLNRLAPQVTSQLIDQTLQLQEINRRKVVVSQSDLEGAVAHIEQSNGLAAGGLRAKLTADGIPFSTLLAQLRIQLGWQTVLHQVLGPGLTPTPGDVRAESSALKAALGSTQYHLSEIFLAVTTPSEDSTARTFANTVITQLRAGAPFPVVAAQFSESDTALQGGDLGFVQLNELDPAVAATVSAMPTGAISNPIRVPGGYDIVQLVAVHKVGTNLQTMLNIRQAFAPFPTPIANGTIAPAQGAVIEKLIAAARNVNSCDQMTALNAAFGNVHQTDPGQVNLATVTPPAFQQLLTTLPLNQPSKPLVALDGATIVMVCSRSTQAEALPSRDDIAQLIVEHRVDLESKQLLEDLRHQSIITD
jgi:peptidyl-prolyl cis-trans isomerase SurA